jgi:phosphoserine phosphatase
MREIAFATGRSSNMIKVAAFDLDGTLTKGESIWTEASEKIGLENIHDELEARFKEGKFKSHVEWSETLLEMWKGRLDKDTFMSIINSKKLKPRALETFMILKEAGIRTAIISGGFVELADRVKQELGIDDRFAQVKLEFGEDNMLRSWKIFRTDFEEKLSVMKFIARFNGADLSECAYVGDGKNDMSVFGRVGVSIAFNARHRVVREAADVSINVEDLSMILPHIGLSGNEITTRKPRNGPTGNSMELMGLLASARRPNSSITQSEIQTRRRIIR